VRLARGGWRPTVVEAFPNCPLEPLFRALSITKPELDLNSFDVITDRRNLRLLLAFVSGQIRKEEFRWDVEVVGNSVLFSRWIDWESRGRPAGYGREFEQHFAKIPRCASGSLVHKRAVAYTLGGLRMMVRFEVDACLEAPAERREGERVEEFMGHRVIVGGALVKDEGVVEMKSKQTGSRNRTYDQDLTQMWLSRTPILCEGIHERGVFHTVSVSNRQENGEFLQWEEANQARIGKLVAVIRMLKDMMEKAEGERFAVVSEKGSDSLEVYRLEPTYRIRLPDDLRENWRKQVESTVEIALQHLTI